MRGKIQNRERARQIIDFSGLRFGNITPTDIDGMIEYQDKAFVYYEFKLQGANMPRGQELALERTVDSHIAAMKQAIAILVEHDVSDCERDIQAAKCLVSRFYLGKHHGWKNPKQKETALSLTKKFFDWVEIGA